MIKVLHIVGGSHQNGSFKGAYILHQALTRNNIDSKILNDCFEKKNSNLLGPKIICSHNNYFQKLIAKTCIFLEKVLKSIFLHSPRETFTLGFFGSDITKFKEYKESDIIHIHWLSQGFINLKSLSKIEKPTIWTMRDMWPFTGGAHYTMDFEKYEKGLISKFVQKRKKKSFKKNLNFIAVSNWLKNIANESEILKNYDIKKIDNNIDLENLKFLDKNEARNILKINTDKQIILYGAQNPQSKRKGWTLFLQTLKKLDKKKYFLLIFGNFWSQETLEEIGIEYKSLGFINDRTVLSSVYCCSDLFVASSIQDAWPKTFAEAMFCQVPVVCFNNTSISEIVDHKINGFIVDDFDSDKLKEGIDWVSKEIIISDKINKNAKSKALNYDSNNIAKKYISLYESLIAKN